MTANEVKPAAANMSLGAGASTAIDNAVPSKIDPWIGCLRKRWSGGCITITVLHQEIRACCPALKMPLSVRRT